MFIAIDDTYGPDSVTESKYVTGLRRTNVAVIFEDSQADFVREQLLGCLDAATDIVGCEVGEFHFVDIFNRKPPWDREENINLKVFEFFFHIYQKYQWPVMIQTVDKRTLEDHGIKEIKGKIEGLDLSERSNLSMILLLLKIKRKYKKAPENINLIVDEGKGRPGCNIGEMVFHDWPCVYKGRYESSKDEPLLQIADFLAYCINRSTHLGMKKNRTEIDGWFLQMVGRMNINCEEYLKKELPINFSIEDFDNLHESDRGYKGL